MQAKVNHWVSFAFVLAFPSFWPGWSKWFSCPSWVYCHYWPLQCYFWQFSFSFLFRICRKRETTKEEPYVKQCVAVAMELLRSFDSRDETKWKRVNILLYLFSWATFILLEREVSIDDGNTGVRRKSKYERVWAANVISFIDVLVQLGRESAQAGTNRHTHIHTYAKIYTSELAVHFARLILPSRLCHRWLRCSSSWLELIAATAAAVTVAVEWATSWWIGSWWITAGAVELVLPDYEWYMHTPYSNICDSVFTPSDIHQVKLGTGLALLLSHEERRF